MPLADYQHEVNDLVLGAPGPYRLEDVSGMGLPQKKPKRYEIGGASGVRWGREFRTGNVITFDGMIVCEGDPAAAYTALGFLREAWAAESILAIPDATVAWRYKMPGRAEQVVQGRPDNLDENLSNLRLGIIPFQATFETRVRLAV